jgi:hypothetical protein
MQKLILATVLTGGLLISGGNCIAAVQCVDSEGEAVIVNNDKPSAKAEAVARAKWAAIEQSLGVEVKAQSVVQNFVLVDDAVSKQAKGVITGFKILNEEDKKETYFVRINACIEPANAREAVSSLALNNSIAIFLPAKKPKVVKEAEDIRTSRSGKSERHLLQTRDEHEEANILSETIIGKLAEQGYTVVDVAPSQAVDAAEIEKAMKSGNYMSLRSLMYKFLSNMLLIGKVDYSISTKKGQDVGYGISMPFNNVTVRLTYRIVTKDASGKQVILGAGTEEARGMASNVEDATAKGLKNLAEKFAPVVLDKVSKYIKGIAKKITVKVDGVSDVSTNFEVKDLLQNISWVTNVDEKGLGEFVVSYPENTVYLANSLGQKGVFKIEKFTPYSIKMTYQKQ